MQFASTYTRTFHICASFAFILLRLFSIVDDIEPLSQFLTLALLKLAKTAKCVANIQRKTRMSTPLSVHPSPYLFNNPFADSSYLFGHLNLSARKRIATELNEQN